jgi:hypothetical protein
MVPKRRVAINARARGRRRLCPALVEKDATRIRLWRKNNPLKRKAQVLRHRYRISLSELDAMREKQGNVCAICGKPDKLVIDHDHATGKVRGLLCNACNTTLGCVHDDTTILKKAIAYLEIDYGLSD